MRKRPCIDPRASFATRLGKKWVRITAIVQVQIKMISPTPHDADSVGFGPGNVRETKSSDTQAVLSFLGPVLATRCIVTIRGYRALGYRALGLRIHVGPFRLAVRSSQTPAEGRGILMWFLADHSKGRRMWYHS